MNGYEAICMLLLVYAGLAQFVRSVTANQEVPDSIHHLAGG